MSNDVVVKSGDIYSLAEGLVVDLTGQEAPIVFSDVITESRVNNGIVCLSFGAVHTDGQNQPKVRIVSRHRMGLIQAQVLRDVLSDLIDDALKPEDS